MSVSQTTQDNFLDAVADMEQALADALESVASQQGVNVEDLSSTLKLIIKKEIVLEFLLEEFQTFVSG